MNRVLKNNDTTYGKLGTLTPLILNNQYLQVGDVVQIFYNGEPSFNYSLICEEIKDKTFHIMGLWSSWNNITNVLQDGFSVKLIKKYYELKDNEIIRSIQVINLEKETQCLSLNKADMIFCTYYNNPCDVKETYANEYPTICHDCHCDKSKKNFKKYYKEIF